MSQRRDIWIAILIGLVVSCGWLASWAEDEAASDQPPPPPPNREHHEEYGERPHQRDRRMGHFRGRHGPRKPLSPQQIEQRIEILGQIHPELVERLRQAPPQRVARMLERRMPHIERFFQMREHDLEGYELQLNNLKLERQSRRLARKLRSKEVKDSPEQAEKIRNEIRELVTQHFELRQQIKTYELVKLERKIEKLRSEVHQQVEKKGEIINQRFQRLVGESDRDAW